MELLAPSSRSAAGDSFHPPRGIRLLTAIGFLFITLYFGNDVLILFESNDASKSRGSYAAGSLVNGKRLPSKGANFSSYSTLGSLLGRTTVHSNVRKLMLASYASLAETHPDIFWIFGETGWPWGGSFYPHRTHQNGLSVDFMVPVIDHDRHSFPFPATIYNGFGYAVEFDSQGQADEFAIDFEALAVHLQCLDTLSSKYGLGIRRVIFAPDLQPLLFASKTGQVIKESIVFSKRPSWVRHDDHYHIDFKIL